MSYMEQTCPHSGAFGYRAPKKGRNLSWFIEIAIGVAVCCGIFAVICLIGGCLGCEACYECAAAYDDCFDCGLEECTRDCNAQSDDCVSCEGVDCFGREGCFACDGKYDCSDCSGEVYYKVELNKGDQTETLKIKAGTSEIPIGSGYNEDRPSDYFTFKGYYNKKIGGDKYIDEDGNVVKKITKDIKLYAQYKELGAGEEFLLVFNTVNPETGDDYFVPTYTDDYVYVGEGYDNFPTEAQLENYEFKGWYTQPNGGGKLIWGPETTEYTVHLSDFNKRYNPDSNDKRLNVYAHYELERFTVYLHLPSDEVQEERVYSGTLFSEFIAQHPYENPAYTFFGWSEYENAGITDTIDANTKIQDDLHVYAIVRKNYTFTFKYRETTSGTDYEEKEIKLVRYQGQTIDLEEEHLLQVVRANEHLYKGYTFNGWAKSTSTNATTMSSIEVNEYAASTYYAKYTERTGANGYKIEYYVYESGQWVSYTQEAFGMGANIRYTYGGQPVALWDCSTWFPGFSGWSETPNGSVIPNDQFEAYTYGDKKLYAVFG